MLKNKKLLAIIMASLMLVSTLAACNKADTDSDSSDKTSSSSEDKNSEDEGDSQEEVDPSSKIDTEKVETFTMFTTNTNLNWENPVAEAITAATGVDLKFNLILDDPTTAISLQTASGQYDDLISNVTGSMEMMTKAGGYVALDDLINEYGANIKDFYGDYYNNIRYSLEDPSIYGFGYGGNTVADNSPGYYWNVAFFLQCGDLAERDYPVIASTEEFKNVLKEELAANPTTADGLPRYGLSLITSDGFRYQFSIIQAIEGMLGRPFNGDWAYDAETGKAVYAAKTEEFKEAVRWFNELYNEGLIDPESFTQNYDTYLSKVSNGQCVGVIDAYWQFAGAAQTLAAANNDSSYINVTPVMDPTTMEWTVGQPGANMAQSGGISITTACKNPEKITNFINFLASEEGQILLEWGVQDVNYTIDADGIRVRNADDVEADNADGVAFTQAAGAKLYRTLFPFRKYGYTTANGQLLDSADASTAAGAYNPVETATLEKYGYTTFSEIMPQPSSFEAREYPDLNTLAIGLTEDTTYVNQVVYDQRLTYYSKAIMASPEEFDGIWDEYMQFLEDSNIAILEEEINTVMNSTMELWNYAG